MIKNDGYTIWNGDAYHVIKSIPDKSVDLLLTDPPYNVGTFSSGNIKLSGRKEINTDIADWDMGEFDPGKIVDEFVRVTKPSGTIMVFTAVNLFGTWRDLLHPHFDRCVSFTWHRVNPAIQIRKRSFVNSCDFILCFWNKQHTFNFTKQSLMHNFFESPRCQSPERLKAPHHPTQKPIKLLSHLIMTVSHEGDIVFDPFMGVGSTGVAALQNNRRFWGIELDETFYQASAKRLRVSQSQIELA